MLILFEITFFTWTRLLSATACASPDALYQDLILTWMRMNRFLPHLKKCYKTMFEINGFKWRAPFSIFLNQYFFAGIDASFASSSPDFPNQSRVLWEHLALIRASGHSLPRPPWRWFWAIELDLYRWSVVWAISSVTIQK